MAWTDIFVNPLGTLTGNDQNTTYMDVFDPIGGGLGQSDSSGLLGRPGDMLFGTAGQVGTDISLPSHVTGDMEAARNQMGRYGTNVGRLGMLQATRSRATPQADAAQGAGPTRMQLGQVRRGLGMDTATAGQQGQATQMMFDAARGEVPSAAEIQQNRGLSQSLANQMAAANSARGGAAASAAAQRGAAMQGAQMQNQARMDAAQMRAQEQATARAQLGQQLTAQRAADQARTGLVGNIAAQQAGLTEAARQQNLANQQQAAMLNPQLALQSRRMDDANAQALLGLGMRGIGQRAAIGGQLADTMLAPERMRLMAEMQNANVENQNLNAILGLGGSIGGSMFGMGG